MSTDTVRRPATIADLERVEGRHELVAGEIVEMSPTGLEHGNVVAEITRLIGNWNAQRRLGMVATVEPGFVIDDRNVRAPDVAFLAPRQSGQAPTQGFSRQLPRMVVEVVSPSDAWSAVRSKAQMWLASGVALVWVVDPGTRVAIVYAPGKPGIELGAEAAIDGGEALPGFVCQVADFFV